MLAVSSAPAPKHSLLLEKPQRHLGSRSLSSTTGSYRADTTVLPGEFLAGLYGGRLGIAFYHLLSSFLASENTHCLFFLVTASLPSCWSLHVLVLLSAICGKGARWHLPVTSLGHVLVVSLILLPHLIQSTWPLLWGKWLRAGLNTSSSAAPLDGGHCLPRTSVLA